MDWPDREIQAPFSYLQRMEHGPMTSGSLVTLKALLSQRGFFYQQHTLQGSAWRRELSLRAQRGTNFARSKIERALCVPKGKLHGCNL